MHCQQRTSNKLAGNNIKEYLMSLTNKKSVEKCFLNYNKNTNSSLSKNNELEEFTRHFHHNPYIKKYSQNLTESLNYFTEREINLDNKKSETIFCRTPKKRKNILSNETKDINNKPTYNKVNIPDYSKKLEERSENKKFCKNRRKQYKLNYLTNDRIIENKEPNSPFRNIKNNDDIFIRKLTNGKDDINEMKLMCNYTLTSRDMNNTYQKKNNKKLHISNTNETTLNNSFFNVNNNTNYLNKKLMGYKQLNKPIYRKNNSQINHNKVQSMSTNFKYSKINNIEINKDYELSENSYNFLKTDNNIDNLNSNSNNNTKQKVLIKKRPNHSIKSDNFNELFICKKNKGQFIEYPINIQNLPTINQLLNKLGFEITQIKQKNIQYKGINYEIYNLNKTDLNNQNENNGSVLCNDCPSAPMSFDGLMKMEKIKKTTNDGKEKNAKSRVINNKFFIKDFSSINAEIKNLFKNKKMFNKRLITSYNMNNQEKNKKMLHNQLRKKGNSKIINTNQENIIDQNKCYFEEYKNNNQSKKKYEDIYINLSNHRNLLSSPNFDTLN